MSRKLEFLYDIDLKFERPVFDHAFCLHCVPRSFPGQQITDYSFRIDPSVAWSMQTDSFGNRQQTGFVEAPHSSFRYTVTGTAIVDTMLRQPGILLPSYRYPTQLTQLSEEMEAFSAGLSLPESKRNRALALMQAVRERMEYVPGETGITTGAAEAFAAGRGVCQDYAHVYLALARRAGLPVRYVNGLTEGDCYSHAWCEVLLDGIWTGIDPTRGQFTDDRYLVFNYGRDYTDCPIERGVFKGITTQIQSITVQVTAQQ